MQGSPGVVDPLGLPHNPGCPIKKHPSAVDGCFA
jgi:hypothetical protein